MPPLESSPVALHPVQGSHPRSTNQTTPEPPNCSKPLCLLLYLGQMKGSSQQSGQKDLLPPPCTGSHQLPKLRLRSPSTSSQNTMPVCGAVENSRKKAKSDPPCLFLEFQKLQLNFTNSGGFWLVCVSQSPNFWLLNQALTQVVEVSLSLATISAFVFVLL